MFALRHGREETRMNTKLHDLIHSKAYHAIERHACKRLRQWLCTKHKVSWRRLGDFLPKACTPRLDWSGLLSENAAFRGRNRDASSGSRTEENRTSGSTRGMWKRSSVRIMRHGQTKESETGWPDLTHRATFRLYTSSIPGWSTQGPYLLQAHI